MPTVAQQVEEKLIQLNRLKEEIDELNEEKAKVVKNINVPLTEAREKAKVIESEADKKAMSIIDTAKRIRAEADAYVVGARSDANNLVNAAKEEMSLVDKAKIDLENKIIDFDAYRIATENAIQQKKADIDNQAFEIRRAMEEASGAKIGMDTREATLNRKEADLVSREGSCESLRSILKAKEDELANKEREVMDKFNENVDNVNKASAAFKEADYTLGVVKREREVNAKLMKEIDVAKADIEEKKAMINAQFAQIDKTNFQLEERKRSLDERMALIELKEKEVDEKLKTLEKLRKK